jgi:capsular exopolysaccharide synthesis family protein
VPRLDQRESSGAALRDALRVFWRRRFVIALFLLLTVGAVVALTVAQEQRYVASASLLFRDPEFDQKLFGTTAFAPSSDPEREAATNVQLASLGVVADRTAKRLGQGLTRQEVADAVKVQTDGTTDVASVNATDPSPKFAALLANTFAREFIAFRRDADRRKVDQAAALIRTELASMGGTERSGVQGRALRERLSQLATLGSLQTGNAELVQPANAPTAPSFPKPKVNIALGIVVGLLLGVGVALLLERLDRRVREPEDFEALFGRPILGAIPANGELVSSSVSSGVVGSQHAEPFRMVRANLRYFDVGRHIRSLVITSATPSEGKTTVALNLAIAAAESGARVILIEADLRRPTLAARTGVSPVPGLTSVLTDQAELDRATRQFVLERPDVGGTRRISVDVVPAGAVPPNPAELIESEAMDALIKKAEGDHDLVIIDTPPASLVSDSIPLLARVDAVIAVARLGLSTRDAASDLRDQLEKLHAPLVGVVINFVEASDSYYYSYAGHESATDGSNGSSPPDGSSAKPRVGLRSKLQRS